jgi:mannose-1-phosphate guanylyltransferase
MTIVPVILCGGSGTRLWPLSRKSFPKQFVPLIEGKSLLQLTLERVAGLGDSVMCVASDEQRMENPVKTNLELIKVQSGSYLGEDDIVRYEDTYGRN